MIKRFLTLQLFLLLPMLVLAQTNNWHGISANDTISFYSGDMPDTSSGYLSFSGTHTQYYWVDSVVTDGNYLVYHFPLAYNIDGPDMDTNISSFMGYKILRDTLTGEEIFINDYQDSFLVKTLSVPGDTWLAMTDSVGITYELSCDSIVPTSTSGAADSVKYFTVHTKWNGVDTNTHYNNTQWMLGKSRGYLRLPVMNSFPYTESSLLSRMDSADDVLSTFSVDFNTKFAVGNEFIYKTVGGTVCSWPGHSPKVINVTRLYHDSIEAWLPMGSDTLLVINRQYAQDWTNCTSTPTYGSYKDTVAIGSSEIYSLVRMLDTTYPHNYYMPYLKNTNLLSFFRSSQRIEGNERYLYVDTSYNNFFESAIYYKNYALDGFGTLKSSYFEINGNAGAPDLGWDFEVLYASDNGQGVPWGTKIEIPDLLRSPDIQSMDFKVFPNPASEYIHVKSLNPKLGRRYEILVKNTVGQVVYNGELQNKNTKISCAHWPSGLYTVSIYDKENLITKKIIKL